jgi:DNA-directed RNA polymerase specialized sigma subunit
MSKLAIKLVIGLVAFILAVVILGPSNYDPKNPKIVKFFNVARIETAFIEYRRDHNERLPVRLSELATNYIELKDIGCLFWPLMTNNTFSSYSEELMKEIDSNTAFVYLGEKGIPANIVLFQQSSLWPQDKDAAQIVVITTNLTHRLMSPKELKLQLLQLTNSIPELNSTAKQP